MSVEMVDKAKVFVLLEGGGLQEIPGLVEFGFSRPGAEYGQPDPILLNLHFFVKNLSLGDFLLQLLRRREKFDLRVEFYHRVETGLRLGAFQTVYGVSPLDWSYDLISTSKGYSADVELKAEVQNFSSLFTPDTVPFTVQEKIFTVVMDPGAGIKILKSSDENSKKE